MNIYTTILILLFPFIFNSCANISPPTGGIKDIIPPKLIKSTPANNEIDYNGKTILLVFNERVDIKDLNEQLIINPIPQGQFVAQVNKNTVKVTLEKELAANTTYTFNFREGIKDVTESNAVQNLQIAFSTGKDLDTASWKGNLIDYLKNIPVKNATISLYSYYDTLNILNSTGIYSTKSNELGLFELNNIKPSIYKAYALSDVNKNDIYDSDKELIAFKDSLIISDTLFLDFFLVKTSIQEFKILDIKSTSFLEGRINFNRGISEIAFDSSEQLYYKLSENKKELTIYNPFAKDSLTPIIFCKDSLNNSLQQRLVVNFEKNDPSDKKSIKKSELTYEVVPGDRQIIPGQLDIGLKFNRPIINYTESFSYKKDTTPTQIPSLKYKWNRELTNLTITGTINFKDSLIIGVPEAAFIDVYSDTSKADKIVITNRNDQNYSSLSGAVNTEKSDYILQLVNAQFEIVKEIKNAKKFAFDYIIPGTYYLRVFVDINKNNMWDTSNLINGIQPEPIYFYKNKFELRSNWEIRDIDFSF